MDGLGRTITTVANAQNSVTLPNAQNLTTRTSYDAAGRRTHLQDAAGRVTQFAYDNLDRLIAVTENVQASCSQSDCNVQTQYRYDRAGNRTAIVDARGNVRTFSYDAANQMTGQTDPLSQTTSWVYDAGGRMTTQHDPRGSTYDLTYTYNGFDLPTDISAGSSTNLSPITASYDPLGRRTRLIDASGTMYFNYDRLNRMTRAGDVKYNYNARGDRAKVTYPDGSAVSYTYHDDGQLKSVIEAGTTLVTDTYDLAGRLSQVVRANGQLTTYAYDGADRLVGTTTSVNGTPVSAYHYTLDTLGQRTVITETLPLSPTISSTRIKTMDFEGGYLVDPTTGADRQTGTVALETSAPIKGGYSLRIPNTVDSTLSETFAGQDDLYVSFYVRVTAYPTATLRIANLTNGTTRTGNIQLTTAGKLRLRNDATKIGSDSIQLALGQVYRVGLHQKKGTGSNAVLEAYVIAGDGTFATPFASSSAQAITTQATQFEFGASSTTFGADIVLDDIALDGSAMPGPSLTTASRTVSYTYDGVYRLTGAVESPGTNYAYTYDLAGNRTSVWVNGTQTQNLSYNAANQVSGWTYDAAGNLLNDGTSTYTYDALGRVTTLNGTTNTYNGDGVLIAQTTGSTSTNYTQDLAAPLSQVLSDGTNRYVYGNPAERLFGVAGSTRTWYASDALGSVRASLNDSGMTQAVANYDPWGVPETSAIAPFGFTGELQQGSNVYLRARWYQAGSGAFTARDPFEGMAERPHSLMPYQYAYANPILLRDPTGMWIGPDVNAADPIDIGVIFGLSVTGSAGPMATGTVGIEWVADLYDFESAYFTYKGGASLITNGTGDFNQWFIQSGLSLVKERSKAMNVCGSIGISGYIGLVKGWKNQSDRSVGSYKGISTVSTVAVSFPEVPLFSVGAQYFESENRSMNGITIGFGISTDMFPVNVSRLNMGYNSAFLKQTYHHGTGKTWTPPTKSQELQFMTAVYRQFITNDIWGVGKVAAASISNIIAINGSRWRKKLYDYPQPSS